MSEQPDKPDDQQSTTADNKPETGEIDPELLKILVCPLTKKPLTYDREANELISKKARLAFPVRDGIPIMLPSEARNLDEPD